jgi:hypothetical protein
MSNLAGNVVPTTIWATRNRQVDGYAVLRGSRWRAVLPANGCSEAMAPATIRTPQTGRRDATCNTITQSSEKPAGTKPSGSSATASTAPRHQNLLPTPSAANIRTGS